LELTVVLIGVPPAAKSSGYLRHFFSGCPQFRIKSPTASYLLQAAFHRRTVDKQYLLPVPAPTSQTSRLTVWQAPSVPPVFLCDTPLRHLSHQLNHWQYHRVRPPIPAYSVWPTAKRLNNR